MLLPSASHRQGYCDVGNLPRLLGAFLVQNLWSFVDPQINETWLNLFIKQRLLFLSSFRFRMIWVEAVAKIEMNKTWTKLDVNAGSTINYISFWHSNEHDHMMQAPAKVLFLVHYFVLFFTTLCCKMRIIPFLPGDCPRDFASLFIIWAGVESLNDEVSYHSCSLYNWRTAGEVEKPVNAVMGTKALNKQLFPYQGPTLAYT